MKIILCAAIILSSCKFSSRNEELGKLVKKVYSKAWVDGANAANKFISMEGMSNEIYFTSMQAQLIKDSLEYSNKIDKILSK